MCFMFVCFLLCLHLCRSAATHPKFRQIHKLQGLLPHTVTMATNRPKRVYYFYRTSFLLFVSKSVSVPAQGLHANTNSPLMSPQLSLFTMLRENNQRNQAFFWSSLVTLPAQDSSSLLRLQPRSYFHVRCMFIP